jgi:putative transposase
MSFVQAANGGWQKAGLFERMWQSGLLDYDNEKGIE